MQKQKKNKKWNKNKTMKTRCQIVHESVFCLSDSTRSICPHRSCTRSPTTPWAWCSHPSRASPTSTPRPRWTTREWSAWGCSTKLSLTLTRWDCSWGGPASTFRRPLFLNESIHLLPQNASEQINAEAENISSPLQVIRRHLSQTEDTKHSEYKILRAPSFTVNPGVSSHCECVDWKDACQVQLRTNMIFFWWISCTS